MSERLIVTVKAPRADADKKDCDVEIKVGDDIVWLGAMSDWTRALAWSQRVHPKPVSIGEAHG